MTQGPMTDGRSRPRLQTDAKIEAAVAELMREGGPTAVTMEAVSERAGVARTTLYRRYTDRLDLLYGVLDRRTPVSTLTDTTPDADGFRHLTTTLREAFDRAGLAQMVGHILAQGPEEMRVWRDRMMTSRQAEMRSFFDRCIAAGTVRADADLDLIIEMLVGAAIAGTATHGRLSTEWPDRVTDLLWPLICAEPESVAQDH